MPKNTQTSFEEILESNKYKIYRICRSYSISPIEPEDLFQEVVYQVWKSLPSFQGNSALNTWIYRITLNVCMRSQLKLKKRDDLTLRFESIQFLAHQEGNSAYNDEKYQALQECIVALEKGEQSIIVLYLEELSYREISEIIGLSENHIAVKMKRIKKKLFNCITPKLD